MTDQELIQLLQEKPAAELTVAEIDEIRSRRTQSPDLHQALTEHPDLESQLMATSPSVPLDRGSVVRVTWRQGGIARNYSLRWSWLIGLGVLVGLGVSLVGSWGKRERQQPNAIDAPKSASQDVASSPDSATSAPIDKQSPAIESTDVPPLATVESIPNPTAVEVAVDEPWSTTLSRDVAPWAANSSRLTEEFKSAGHDEFPESEAKRWLAPIERHPFEWSTDLIGKPVRRIARFNGLAKLRAPWPNDAVLRLTPFDVTDLTLYFWRGSTGVAFRYYNGREPHVWAAFEIVRNDSSPKATRWGLLTTDNGSYARSTPGMLDVRQQNDNLVLARGGIILMSVPFAGAPLEVFVEGQFRLRGMSMYRSVPFPDPPESPRPLVLSGPAATLPWAISAESNASLTTNKDGSASMTVDSQESIGIVSLPFGWMLAMQQSLRATSLFEVIVQVESADPGTGIFLGDRDGRPLQRLGFFRDTTTQQITFGLLRPSEIRSDATFNPNELPPPYLATSSWLKLVAGLGTVHIQTSGDGRHWGHVAEHSDRDWPGAVGSMGLFGLPGPNARTIRICQVQVRDLTGITDLADPTLRRLVAPFTNEELRDLSSWNRRIDQSRPAGIDANRWFTANAVATLSQGLPKEIGAALLRQLVTDAMKSTRSFDKKRELLEDTCLLGDFVDEATAKMMEEWYEQLGWQLARSGDPNALPKLRSAWLRSPIWSKNKLQSVCEGLQSHEVIQAVYRRDWSAAWSLAQSVSYWTQPPHPDFRPADRTEVLDRHARWAKSLVAEFAPRLDDGTAAVMPVNLRHPLIPVFNKEAYNLRAELQSALSGGNDEDACRIAMSIGPGEAQGLLPEIDDRDLFVSMSTIFSIARNRFPGFATTMADKFEPQGLIRVRSAINRGDIAALQLATLQLMGTDAAREAHTWLGDMNLSVGRFDVAEQHFRDAILDASNQRRESLEPRLMLASLLGGQLSPSRTTISSEPLPARRVDFNGTTISVAEFQSIVENLNSRPAPVESMKEAIQTPPAPFPQSAYKLVFRAEFDGYSGNNAGRWEYRFGDPFGRQLSTASDDQRIYVSNRFQVNAYSLDTGRQIWAQGLGSDQGDAYALPFSPMQPLVASDRLFFRRLTKAGVELACLNARDGEVIWSRRPSHSVLTDPVIWNGRLFAVLLTKLEDDQYQIEAGWFNSMTGAVTSARPLFRLREPPEQQYSGRLTVIGRIAVCTVGGTTVHFDWQGETQWLRRHILMRKPVDELAEDFQTSPPVISEGRVIVTTPGVRAVCCLDLDTGQTVWERPMTNLRGLVGVTSSRVVVDTVTGLEALDTDTGNLAWEYPIQTRLEAFMVNEQNVLVTRRMTMTKYASKPVLVWLDSNSGEERGQAIVDVTNREEFQLGPLFSAGDKWWSFVGQTWKDPKRELHEFVRVPTAMSN